MFAANVWWRAAIATGLLLFPVIGIGALVRPGPVGTDIGVAIILAVGCLGGIAVLQMLLLSFRAGQVKWHLDDADPGAVEEPLPPGSLGLPSRWDFWVMLVIGLAVIGILLSAGTRSEHY